MTRLPRPDLFAFLTICVSGCAASPIVNDDWSADSEGDSGFVSMEGDVPVPSDDDDEPGVDPNAAPADGPSLGSPGNTQRPDAGAAAPSPTDAGRTPRDAGVQGSDGKDTGVSAVSSKDAGSKDAGSKAAEPDSGTTTTPTPARDAGQPPTKPAAGGCRTASDCTQSCVPLGVFNCCKANGSCGCTWAIGAYCT